MRSVQNADLCGRRSFSSARKVGGAREHLQESHCFRSAKFPLVENLLNCHRHVNTGSLRISHTVLVVMAERDSENYCTGSPSFQVTSRGCELSRIVFFEWLWSESQLSKRWRHPGRVGATQKTIGFLQAFPRPLTPKPLDLLCARKGTPATQASADHADCRPCRMIFF